MTSSNIPYPETPRHFRNAVIAAIFVACWLLSHPAYAGEPPVQFIRPLCMSEDWIRHFSVHREELYGLFDYIYQEDKLNHEGTYPETKKDHLLEMSRDYGLLLADKFSYTCALSSTYKVFGFRPREADQHCAFEQQIVLSLEKNGHSILDHVPFSPWCIDDGSAYIANFTIDDNAHHIAVTISNGDTQRELPLNHFKKPLTAVDVDCLVRKGYLDMQLKNQEHALDACLPNYVK